MAWSSDHLEFVWLPKFNSTVQVCVIFFLDYSFLAISFLNIMQTAGAIGGVAASLIRVPTEVDFSTYAFFISGTALLGVFLLCLG